MAGQDAEEAVAALERLVRNAVIPLEEARLAARLITGNDAYEFPGPSSNGSGSLPTG